MGYKVFMGFFSSVFYVSCWLWIAAWEYNTRFVVKVGWMGSEERERGGYSGSFHDSDNLIFMTSV